MHARQRYARLSAESVLTRLRDAVNGRDQRLDELRFRLDVSMQRRLQLRAQQLAILVDHLRRENISVRIAGLNRHLQRVDQRLHRTTAQIINPGQMRVNRASAGLRALSPLAVLSRGYALVYAANGKLLRSATDTTLGQTIRARLAHGTLEAEVKRTSIDEANVTETNNS
jgi:exodeoxyribonuclease VII large subunit